MTEGTAKVIYEKTISDWEEAQDRYDTETDHSINETNQQVWDNLIDSLLKK